MHVVVIGVRDESSVHPSPITNQLDEDADEPSQPIDRVLLVLDRLGNDLSIEVIVESEMEMRLDRQSFVEELFEEILSHLQTSRVSRCRQAREKECSLVDT